MHSVRHLKPGGNELLVLAWAGPDGGGLPGIPMLLLDAGSNSGNASLRDCLSSSPACVLPSLTSLAPMEAIDLLIASGYRLRAFHRCLALSRCEDAPAIRHHALCKLVYLHWLNAVDPLPGSTPEGRREAIQKALAAFASVLQNPSEAGPSQEAVQAFCDITRRMAEDPEIAGLVRDRFPGFGSGVTHLAQDRRTRGDWDLAYGREGYVLSAMAQVADWPGGPEALSVSVTVPGDRDTARCWLARGARETADPRALVMPGPWRRELAASAPFPPADFLLPTLPGRPVRRASWWDDHGEQHAFDDDGPDLNVTVGIPPGEHVLSLHISDFDWSRTRHPRQQSILLFDDRDRLVAAAWTGRSRQGIYERFRVTGPTTLKARILKHRSACVAVSGVFLDPVDSPRAARWNRYPRAFEAHLGKLHDTDHVCDLVLALAAENAPGRLVYMAAGRLFECLETAPATEREACLRRIVERVTARRLYPLRAWALREWREMGLPGDTVIVRAGRLISD